MDNYSEKDLITASLEDIQRGKRSLVEIAQDALPDGAKALSVTIRRPVEEPVRAETPRRAHLFESVRVMAKYLETRGTVNSVALIDAATGETSVVLDETQDKGLEVVKFKPRMHPLLVPWVKAISDSNLGVEAFIALVMANKKAIQCPPPAQLLAVVRQLRISKSSTMECGQGCDAVNGVMVHTTIRGVAQDQVVSLPDEIRIKVPLFIEMPEQEITLDLVVAESGCPSDPITIKMSSADLEVVRLNQVQEMAESIKDAMPEGAVVGFGSVGHSPWPYIGC